MGWFGHDVRQGLRVLRATRGISAAALVTIALGVGGTTAMFSVVYGVLMRPLPYPEPERLVGLWEVHPGANAPLKNDLLSRPTYRAWAAASSTLEGIASYSVGEHTASGAGAGQRLRGARVTPSLFGLLRVHPARGRLLTAADAEPDAAPVVVIADRLWRDRFGGDPAAIGATLTIDDTDHLVVGVAPPRFAFPEPDIALYTPLVIPRTDAADRAIGIMVAVARLAPGANAARAEVEGTALARAASRPFANLVYGEGGPVEVRVRSLVDQKTRAVRPALLVLSAGIGLLLLIACANVANLLLSRASDRTRELAIRAALGAGRFQLLRQLLVESLILAMAGGVLGIGVGWALTRAVPRLAPSSIPRLGEIRFDAGFLLVAVAIAGLVGMLAGVWPALTASRADLLAAMRSGGRSIASSGGRTRRLLVVAEAALAVVLMVGAALLVRSYLALVRVDAGYQPAQVLTADITMPRGANREQRATALAWALVDRLQGRPGIGAIAVGTMAPFGGVLSSSGFALPGLVTAQGQPVIARALQGIVTPGYRAALGIRQLEGRFLVAADSTSPTIAMVVNDTFARTYFEAGRPVTGRRFVGMFPRILGRTDAVVIVVGVVDDVLPDRVNAQPQPQIYLPMGVGFGFSGATVLVKVDGDPGSVAPILRRTVEELAPGTVLARVGLLSDKRTESASEPRFTTLVLGAFAALAVALAVTGVYGVLSYNVAQRRRELGVRGALGARRSDLLALIMGEGMTMVALGTGLGAATAALLTRGMTSVLFGVAPLDPLAFACAAVLLLAMAAVASGVPALRAARTDPADALRAE